MGVHFKQLTMEDRVAICHLIKAGISKQQIAFQLNVHRSTVYRELAKSYQKGTVENGNKQLREWLSRDCWIDLISQQKINYRTQSINQRPMKCLNYLTPKEVFYSKLKKLDTIS